MIKNIIKRNGQIEEFDPNKLNMWGEWAAKTLGKSVAWGDVVINAVTTLPENTTSVALQDALIDTCISRRTWAYNRMAGRLYASTLYKQAFNKEKEMMLTDKTSLPTIRDLHLSMLEADILSEEFVNSYTEQEYKQINDMLAHSLDMTYPHYQIKQIISKYSLKDRTTDEVRETPQYVYMRVAMRMAQNKTNRLHHISRLYYFYSRNKINIPTPYYTNAGTGKNGFNSCCVYKTNDTVRSLAAGDHIAYVMTYSSAGIGACIKTRSEGSPIRGGIIEHRGKTSYYKALVGAINANMQNGRGGAATVTYDCYDPDIKMLQTLKHPLTPASKQIRGIDYSMAFNLFFIEKAARKEKVALFSIHDAPEVYEHLTNPLVRMDEFHKAYEDAIAAGKAKAWVDARDILLSALNQAIETGRHYYTNLTEINTHTPFNDPIYQLNLCQEIALPTKGYESVFDLAATDDSVSGEVGMCSLAAIVVSNIENDKEYAEAAYYCLYMIHTAIHEADYELPHMAFTAKARNSAGVGIIGVAHWMAKNKLKYDETDGQIALHKMAETHYWHLLNASIKMSEEYGLAEWMHKTKWPDGWLPLDTYNKNVDTIADFKNERDWESIRKIIVANGGIHNSVLVAHMPTESSSISSGTTNGIYPIRGTALNKSNDDDTIAWLAPDADKLAKHYQNAYGVLSLKMIMVYGIFQKWNDQGISADLWETVVGTDKLSSTKLLSDVFATVKYGVKSRYYINSKTSKNVDLNQSEEMLEEVEILDDDDCAGCTI